MQAGPNSYSGSYYWVESETSSAISSVVAVAVAAVAVRSPPEG